MIAALPHSLRAGRPAPLRGIQRDQVRLMVVDRASGSVTHTRFDRIGTWLGPGDLLVLNRSRTLPAAMLAHRESGEVVQIRPCVRRAAVWDLLAVEPEPPHRNLELRAGEMLRIGDGLMARVEGPRPDIPLLWRVTVQKGGLEQILAHGDPIRYSYVPEAFPWSSISPSTPAIRGRPRRPLPASPSAGACLAACGRKGSA